jgi:putative tricarboxylic transport membrane protein
LTKLALKFGPPEFFALMLVGLSLATGLAGKSLVRALISTVLGLIISMIGIDPVMGVPRFAFGQKGLLDGVGVVPMAMGMFGIGEILLTVGNSSAPMIKTKFRELWLTRQELRDSIRPILRGTFIGFFMGLIPGVGVMVPTFIAYATEKRISRNPEEFGTGRIEGVASPESANNAYCNAAMIPLFTLGIPGSAVIAILMSAFMMNGIIPGPFLFKEHADLAWAVIASFYIGNLILVILNLPAIPLWVSLLKTPKPILYTIILIFCVIGAYSLQNSIFDVGLTLVFGILGYIFKKLDFPMAPMILTVILGPLMERGMRQSLEMSRGDFSIFFTRPISLGLIILSVFFIISSLSRSLRDSKKDSAV